MFTRKSPAARLVVGAVAIGALALTGCAATGEPTSSSAPAAPAEDACLFFGGRTIEFMVPYAAGGGYDILARVLIPGLENALGARVLPINKPGAGGLLAINELSMSPADGTRIGIVNGTGAAAAILAGAEGPTFGFDDLSYIGRAAVDDLVVVTNANREYQSWDDIADSEGFRFGSTGRGSSDYIVANALIRAFDLKDASVVVGFESQSEADLALIQGNVDAIAGPLDSRRVSIVAGETTGVLSFAEVAPEDVADAAVFSDLDLTVEGQGIIDGINLLTDFGRPVVAPAGMDEDRLACLQDAFEAAMSDPEVLEQAERTQRELSFLSGTELLEVIRQFDELSDEFIEVLKASY